MNNAIWLIFVIITAFAWSSTDLLYKRGAGDGKEEHICLKYSVGIGLVFFVSAIICLIVREASWSLQVIHCSE